MIGRRQHRCPAPPRPANNQRLSGQRLVLVAACLPAASREQSKSRPADAVRWAENEPVVDGGNLPRPFRHLRLAEHRSPDPSSSQVPVHSVLVQKSVTTVTNPAGRLSPWMLGNATKFRKPRPVKSWQPACLFTAAVPVAPRRPPNAVERPGVSTRPQKQRAARRGLSILGR